MDPLDIRRTRPAETNLVRPLRETASQTAGPYVHIGCLPGMVGVEGTYPSDLTANRPLEDGVAITIRGRVLDGDGEPCRDAMLEFWQPDHDLWQRTGTDLETGEFAIRTAQPTSYIAVWIVARGINIGLSTRIYLRLPDGDPHLAFVPPERRETLLARTEGDGYRFDIRLQGEGETAFFDA